MSDPADQEVTAEVERELSESDPNGGGPDGLAGGMGVSSERTGRVRGSEGEVSHGTEDTSSGSDAGADPTDSPPD